MAKAMHITIARAQSFGRYACCFNPIHPAHPQVTDGWCPHCAGFYFGSDLPSSKSKASTRFKAWYQPRQRQKIVGNYFAWAFMDGLKTEWLKYCRKHRIKKRWRELIGNA